MQNFCGEQLIELKNSSSISHFKWFYTFGDLAGVSFTDLWGEVCPDLGDFIPYVVGKYGSSESCFINQRGLGIHPAIRDSEFEFL